MFVPSLSWQKDRLVSIKNRSANKHRFRTTPRAQEAVARIALPCWRTSRQYLFRRHVWERRPALAYGGGNDHVRKDFL
jgi:hypothetical protein